MYLFKFFAPQKTVETQEESQMAGQINTANLVVDELDMRKRTKTTTLNPSHKKTAAPYTVKQKVWTHDTSYTRIEKNQPNLQVGTLEKKNQPQQTHPHRLQKALKPQIKKEKEEDNKAFGEYLLEMKKARIEAKPEKVKPIDLGAEEDIIMDINELLIHFRRLSPKKPPEKKMYIYYDDTKNPELKNTLKIPSKREDNFIVRDVTHLTASEIHSTPPPGIVKKTKDYFLYLKERCTSPEEKSTDSYPAALFFKICNKITTGCKWLYSCFWNTDSRKNSEIKKKNPSENHSKHHKKSIIDSERRENTASTDCTSNERQDFQNLHSANTPLNAGYKSFSFSYTSQSEKPEEITETSQTPRHQSR